MPKFAPISPEITAIAPLCFSLADPTNNPISFCPTYWTAACTLACSDAAPTIPILAANPSNAGNADCVANLSILRDLYSVVLLLCSMANSSIPESSYLSHRSSAAQLPSVPSHCLKTTTSTNWRIFHKFESRNCSIFSIVTSWNFPVISQRSSWNNNVLILRKIDSSVQKKKICSSRRQKFKQ